MKLGIGIPNYNRSGDVCSTVKAALNQTRSADELIVLDNASTDNSIDRLQSEFGKRIDLIASPTNGGSSGGFSQLSSELVRRSCDIIVLLDSDCFLKPDAVEQMLKVLETDPRVGICGARIMHADRPEIIQECGAYLDWQTATFQLNRKDQPVTKDTELPLVEFVDYVPACALAARKEVFQEIGHFDTEFFIYFDDIEWCHRAGKNEYKVAVANRAEAHHVGGGKVKTNHFSTYYFWRNRFRFYPENAPNRKALFDYLISNAARAIATSETLGQSNSATIIREALHDALKGTFGPKDFNGISLALDQPAKCLLAGEIDAKCHEVEHIFDPTTLPDDSVLEDPFGKQILAATANSLRDSFLKNLQIIENELKSLNS
ncbi:glycosyltransferase family 2 protein [Pelagicoccus albus]|uniref:Glycosyltransferase family 2 protein n=1 Tax=Pelagicoccus albus TaxID=415222 RepID=A0A7X1B770_9BACT|nr:glycosyltransferase family 2 protein [Pelagicoccus albus]MBC2606926.1 glycosyltransferase family 2 protein [Pelagicoccus albus]